MHVLIVGANGQLGQAVQAVCDMQHSVTVWGRQEADIADPAIVDQITDARPDLVINCAAWTNVDGAEKEPDAAFAVNALGAFYLATACARIGAVMVHVSTNEVFEGTPGKFYYEYDQPRPASVYARSKLAGEVAASHVLDQLFVVRVAWLFGPGGNNFPSKIVAAADRHGALRVVDEEMGNPTYAPDVAAAIFRLVETGRYGIYHLVNQGHTSRFGLAQAVLQATRREHIALTPIRLAEWPRPAPPPPHAVLVNQAAAALGIALRPWQEAVQAYVEATYAETSDQAATLEK
ncbi:MAG: dTDP-4-dehydrorhamnose reductase [Caldilineaceae bacterium]|nr:dTDP-4-dehydrorhamnose reductase [Caldilineaceae bacterium]